MLQITSCARWEKPDNTVLVLYRVSTGPNYQISAAGTTAGGISSVRQVLLCARVMCAMWLECACKVWSRVAEACRCVPVHEAH